MPREQRLNTTHLQLAHFTHSLLQEPRLGRHLRVRQLQLLLQVVQLCVTGFACRHLRVLLAEQRLVGLVALLGLLRAGGGERRLLLQHRQLALRCLQLRLQLPVLRLTPLSDSHSVAHLRDHRVRLVLGALAQLHLVHAVRELQRLQRLLHAVQRRRQLRHHQHLVALRQHVL